MFSKKVALVAAIAVVAVIGTVCVFSPETVGFRFRVIPSFKGPVDAAWTNWKVKYGKTYGGPEDKARYQVFKSNFKIVQEHNAQGRNFTLAMNQFADLTNKEFAALYTGSSTAFKGADACPAPNSTSLTRMYMPESLDWRTKGRVGAVKNQQQCGSCWAFSTTGSLEGLNAKQTGQPGSFSEQELVDCSTGYGNFGCGGGWVQNAYHYVLDNGIANESDYQYTGTDDTCRNSSAPRAFKLTGCANVAPKSVDALKQALQNGPVSIYVEADQSAFQLYNTGVVDDATCFAEGAIDHAVLAVGYTANSWIVKNSWGTSWGDQGYIQISTETTTDARGICGIISNYNTYPL